MLSSPLLRLTVIVLVLTYSFVTFVVAAAPLRSKVGTTAFYGASWTIVLEEVARHDRGLLVKLRRKAQAYLVPPKNLNFLFNRDPELGVVFITINIANSPMPIMPNMVIDNITQPLGSHQVRAYYMKARELIRVHIPTIEVCTALINPAYSVKPSSSPITHWMT
ncbi:hypothetical protein TWF281_007084 [Arthrobotrys megalospora]